MCAVVEIRLVQLCVDTVRIIARLYFTHAYAEKVLLLLLLPLLLLLVVVLFHLVTLLMSDYLRSKIE